MDLGHFRRLHSLGAPPSPQAMLSTPDTIPQKKIRSIYNSTRRYSSEDQHRHFHGPDNLKPVLDIRVSLHSTVTFRYNYALVIFGFCILQQIWRPKGVRGRGRGDTDLQGFLPSIAVLTNRRRQFASIFCQRLRTLNRGIHSDLSPDCTLQGCSLPTQERPNIKSEFYTTQSENKAKTKFWTL